MKNIISFFLMLVTLSVQAGWQEGQITKILVRQSDGLHYFFMSGTATNRPACAAGHTYWILKDENSIAGKSQLSMLLTAYASGKTVSVSGTDACTRWGDGEDVNVIQLK